jgi:hypothetical protein
MSPSSSVLESILHQLKQIYIQGDVREKRFSNRDFLQFLGYSPSANKSLERLLDGETEPSFEQLLSLERNVQTLKPLQKEGFLYQEKALKQLEEVIRQYKSGSIGESAEVMADLAFATESDVAEGKQYFERFFRAFALGTVTTIWDVRKSLVGLAWYASQNATDFKMTMTAARSVWQQDENEKTSSTDSENQSEANQESRSKIGKIDRLASSEADRLARLFMRLLRNGYRRGLNVTLVWQLPEIETLKPYFLISKEDEDKNKVDYPMIIPKELKWLRGCLVKNFSQLRHLIPNNKGLKRSIYKPDKDKLPLIKALAIRPQMSSFRNPNNKSKVIFPPATDFVCSYSEEGNIVYGGLLFSSKTIDSLESQANSAYLISESIYDSLIVKHFELYDSKNPESFKEILYEIYSHKEFEEEKLNAEQSSLGYYTRSYDYPAILKSRYEFLGMLRPNYKKILERDYFDPDKTDAVIDSIEERVKYFNENIFDKEIKIILPIEALLASSDNKLKDIFGFRGAIYEEENYERKYLRFKKLVDLITMFPKCIAFSSNDCEDAEMFTSSIFPNKASYLVTFEEIKEDSHTEGIKEDSNAESKKKPVKFRAFFEKRDSSVREDYQIHYEIIEESLALGSFFSFQNKWSILMGTSTIFGDEGQIKQKLRQAEQLRLRTKALNHLTEQLVILVRENPELKYYQDKDCEIISQS